ncbi:hypothetical protein LTR85_010032 [Meristemomyces frigidus]|nr:hypothetical protein LTR85_010032 [Meristemomyces frigidus]
MGLPSTGTKSQLDSVIRGHLDNCQRTFNGGRVVSVDMGIRNLAFCVMDVPRLDSEERLGSKSLSSPLTVSHWHKRDLLSAVAQSGGISVGKPADVADGGINKGGRKRKPAITAGIPKSAFTPSVLSKTAYDVTVDILSYKPSVILIERQRFRSGGAAAIQEWTVRVNMLESMIWACLRTMRETRKPKKAIFPDVHPVNPASVARFWTAAPDVSLRPPDNLLSPDHNTQNAPLANKPKRATRKVQKSEKIAVVRSWLEGVGPTEVSLDFKGEAAKTATAFAVADGRARRKAAVAEGEAPMGKLDDLADCLLQAVTWVRWEENSRRLNQLLEA